MGSYSSRFIFTGKISNMITIRPIRKDEIPAVKYIIHSVAYNIFGFDGTLEDSIRYYTDLEILNDMDDIQAHYFNNGGTFLIAHNGEQVIGSGALRKLDEETAELKRMWLLETWHGQGVGYRLFSKLIHFAKEKGYARIRLQTSPEQIRALAFYQKVGFYEIPCYSEDVDEVSMELSIR